ncbi:hypothetical protein QUF50_06930 [Thiotrichales bacterium HSG1]|nr:hypothetical protein [Thiotrichales bacterium HSG1]
MLPNNCSKNSSGVHLPQHGFVTIDSMIRVAIIGILAVTYISFVYLKTNATLPFTEVIGWLFISKIDTTITIPNIISECIEGVDGNYILLTSESWPSLINKKDIIMGGKVLLFLTTLSVVSILFLTISVIKFLNFRNRKQCDTWNRTIKGYADNCSEIKPLPIELKKLLAELDCLKGIMTPKDYARQKKILLDKFGR